MEDGLAHAIERRLRWIFWLLVPGTVVYSLVAVGLLIVAYDEHFRTPPEVQAKIVVARVDLAVGDELTKTNLALEAVPECQWPESIVSPGHALILMGHRMVRPVAKGRPVEWYDTDIPIPTPSVAAERVRHQINPEPEAAQ